MLDTKVLRVSFPRLLGTLCVVALLTACAGTPQEPTEFAQSVSDTWAAENASGQPIVDAWWQRFDDPVLNALITKADALNPTVTQAAARMDAALAQARIAGANLYPQINADFSGSRQKASPTGPTNKTYGLSLNTSWEIDIWGRLSAQQEAARSDFVASENDLRAARQSIAAQITKAYFTVIEAREQIDLSSRTVVAFEETARQTADRSDAGIGAPNDKLLSFANLQSATAGLAQRRETGERVTRQLDILVRDYPDGIVSTAESLPAAPPAPPAGLPATLLERRPDIQAAMARLQGADYRTVAARRALLPNISLTGSYGTTSSDLGDLLSGNFSVWSIAGQLVQPIFQGGRLRAQVKLSEAQAREAYEAYAETVLRALSEVEAALAADAQIAAREEALRLAAQAAEESTRIALDRYSEGTDPFLVVLESQQRALDARSAWIAARRARLDNRIDLHLALGGGFSEPRPVTLTESNRS